MLSVTEEGGKLVLQQLFHSTYDQIIISKMVTTYVGVEFRKKEEARWS